MVFLPSGSPRRSVGPVPNRSTTCWTKVSGGSAHPATGRPMVHDHRRILATGLARLRSTLQYRPLIFELLAKRGVTVDLDAMLPVYYQERGWDGEGVPTQEKLAELGLASI